MTLTEVPILFQFTPLREGRPDCRPRLCVWNISIHAPPRGATWPPPGSQILSRHFNSRPSARGDGLRRGEALALDIISIHAPPRGATQRLLHCGRGYQISIHAPPRGATEKNLLRRANPSYFNSRPSARGDMAALPASNTPLNFNSRPSARGDSLLRMASMLSAYFNSRPSARGDSMVLPITAGAA